MNQFKIRSLLGSIILQNAATTRYMDKTTSVKTNDFVIKTIVRNNKNNNFNG